MNKNNKKWLSLMLFSLLLISCENSGELQIDMVGNQIKLQTLQKPEPIPKLESLAAFAYSEALNQSNPFQAKQMEYRQGDKNLEHFALKSLKFVGVLKHGSDIWALISRSDSFVSPVKIGDFLGEKAGKVIAIKETFLQLEEKTLVAGIWKKEIKTMYLHPNPQGK